MSAVTAFQRVAVAVADAIKAGGTLAGGNVKANPTRPWPTEVAACVSVRLGTARRVADDSCGDQWSLGLEVDCEARGLSGADPADAVDALLSSVANTIAATDLSAAGVMQREPESSIDWQFGAAETPLAMATYSFSLLVHTGLDVLTPSAP